MMHRYPSLLCALLAGSLATSGCGGGAANKPVDHPKDETAGQTAQTSKPKTPAPAEEEPIPELAFPQDEGFRDAQPDASAPRAFQLPKIKRFKLKNGVEVFLVEQHQLPTVTIDINFDGGALSDPLGKEGQANVCMDLMTEGTEKLDKLAFAEALADTATEIFSYASSDTQGISMRTLSKHLPATKELFIDALLTPGMRQEDLDRIVKRSIEQLKQTRGTPFPVASRVGPVVLYGPKHPRGRVQTDGSLGAITVADCKAFHQSTIKPSGARLFVVGDMTEADVRAHFGSGAIASWRGKPARTPRQPKPKSQGGKVFFVDIPGAAQSAVYVMHFGPARKARDYMETTMMANVLGGGFASRINMNLREDKGYSYGARGGFGYNRDYGLFYMASSVRSDSTYQTVVEMMNEIVAMKKNQKPATEAELGREKDGSILSLPGDFETARQALGQYRTLVYHDLPLDYFNTYVARVSKVTAAQVSAAAKKHLDPDGAKIIVVGDANAPLIHRVDGKDVPLEKDGQPVTLLDGLRDLLAGGQLGKGALVIMDVDGNPVP